MFCHPPAQPESLRWRLQSYTVGVGLPTQHSGEPSGLQRELQPPGPHRGVSAQDAVPSSGCHRVVKADNDLRLRRALLRQHRGDPPRMLVGQVLLLAGGSGAGPRIRWKVPATVVLVEVWPGPRSSAHCLLAGARIRSHSSCSPSMFDQTWNPTHWPLTPLSCTPWCGAFRTAAPPCTWTSSRPTRSAAGRMTRPWTMGDSPPPKGPLPRLPQGAPAVPADSPSWPSLPNSTDILDSEGNFPDTPSPSSRPRGPPPPQPLHPPPGNAGGPPAGVTPTGGYDANPT